jgi:HEPN domain-containing protein
MSYLDVKEFEKWMRSSLKTLESAKKDLEFEFYNWRASRGSALI